MKLEITHENGRKEIITYKGSKAVVGNGDTADIKIDGEHIARNQIILEQIDGKIYVTDLDNPNGTYMNDELLEPNKKVEFVTFFPIQIGPKIFISLLDENTADAKQALSELPSFKENKTSTTILLDKTRTKIKADPKNKKALNKNEPKSNPLFTALFVLAAVIIAVIFYEKKHESKMNEKLSTLVDPSIAADEEAKKIREQYGENIILERKCEGIAAKDLCAYLNLNPALNEGAIVKDRIAYVFMNFTSRINSKNTEDLGLTNDANKIYMMLARLAFNPILWTRMDNFNISLLSVYAIDPAEQNKAAWNVRFSYEELIKEVSPEDALIAMDKAIAGGDHSLFEKIVKPVVLIKDSSL